MLVIPPDPQSPEQLAIVIISAIISKGGPLIIITAIMAWVGAIHRHRNRKRANRINRRDDHHQGG